MKRLLVFLMILLLSTSVLAQNRTRQYVDEEETDGNITDGNVIVIGPGRQEKICTDMCGDGTCQRVVCMGTGCPCSETFEDCPEDCDEDSEPITEAIMERLRTRANTAAHVRKLIRLRSQFFNESLENVTPKLKHVYRNQNRVRVAVHALLAMENVTGGIGRNISQIAREFNNSIRARLAAEEQIENRSRLLRWFAGGDAEAAEEILSQINQSRKRMMAMVQLRDNCNCSEEVMTLLQEQMDALEAEDGRLQELAEEEKKSKGLFGWLWK